MPEIKEGKVLVTTREFMYNPLMNRKQFLVEVSHPRWCGTVPTKSIRKKLASMYKIADDNCISVFGMNTHFGGGKTTGFGIIYDDLASAKRIEPRYRLIRMGLATKPIKSRKSQKERKNRAKKVGAVRNIVDTVLTLLSPPQFRGTKKSKAADAPKKK